MVQRKAIVVKLAHGEPSTTPHTTETITYEVTPELLEHVYEHAITDFLEWLEEEGYEIWSHPPYQDPSPAEHPIEWYVDSYLEDVDFEEWEGDE